MFETTALDNVANRYVDKDVGASIPGTRIEADDQNIKQDELVAPVESSGQSLDATGVKRNQVARAMFLNGVGSQSMFDSGTANAKVLTPVSGASGYVFGETYAQLTGAVLLFKNLVSNTGAVTIDCGQTTGTLLGVKSFTKAGGVAFAASELAAGDYYTAIYDLTNDRFELPVNSMLVSDLAFSGAWNGVADKAPSQNAVYDIVSTLDTMLISDLAYSGAWNGVTDKAPSKNAVYDIISTLDAIPSGEKILFYKDTAVIGYSLLDTLNDKVVYVTKGSAAGGQAGGIAHSGGTWSQPTHYHTVNDHVHAVIVPFSGWPYTSGATGNGYLVTRNTLSELGIMQSNRVLTSEPDGPNTDHKATLNSWRPSAYNFTMQQRS